MLETFYCRIYSAITFFTTSFMSQFSEWLFMETRNHRDVRPTAVAGVGAEGHRVGLWSRFPSAVLVFEV